MRRPLFARSSEARSSTGSQAVSNIDATPGKEVLQPFDDIRADAKCTECEDGRDSI